MKKIKLLILFVDKKINKHQVYVFSNVKTFILNVLKSLFALIEPGKKTEAIWTKGTQIRNKHKKKTAKLTYEV